MDLNRNRSLRYAMKLNFDKSDFKNLSKSLEYEWLEFNDNGAYSYTTFSGLDTRRIHGLLNVPYGETNQIAVVLSKLEESIFINNHLFEISTNQYSDVFFPHGYKFIESFSIKPFPTTIFKIGDRRLKKTVILAKERNILIVRYELLNQGDPVKLVIKPFLGTRHNQDLTAEVQGLNTDSYLGQNFVRWAPKPDMPELNVHFNQGEFIPASLWYHNFYYAKDATSKEKSVEDLLNPGFFRVELKPYSTFDLYLSPDNIDDFNFDYEAIYRNQADNSAMDAIDNKNQYLKDLLNRKLSCQACVLSPSITRSTQSTRNFLFILPILISVAPDKDRFFKLIMGLLDSVDKGLLPKQFPETDEDNQFEDADTALWLINLAYMYYRETEDDTIFSDELLEKFKDIVANYAKGTSANIYVDKTGLVFSGNK